MEPDRLNQYWTYIPLINKNNKNTILAFFNIAKYKDKIFVYTDEKMDFPEISSSEEKFDLLKDFTEEEKDLYLEILKENGINGYYLYSFDFNKENIDNFISSLSLGYSSNFKNKGKPMKKFEDFDNSNELTFYIILRNDLNRSTSLKMIDISDITKVIQEDLRIKALEDNKYNKWYYDFANMKNNTVILQASGKDLFEDNFIPSEYKDPNIIFNYIWDNEEQVAKNNFRLKEGNTVCFGYLGKKKDMPKFVRKLKLYGGK